MTRQDLLDEINEIIVEEYGTSITEQDTIVSSEIDSFAMTMLVSTIGDKYGIYDKQEFEELDFVSLTAKGMIDRILDANK